MNTILPRLSAAAFAAVLAGALGCGDSGGCGEPSSQYGKSNLPPPITCGPGTIQQAGTCVAAQPVVDRPGSLGETQKIK